MRIALASVVAAFGLGVCLHAEPDYAKLCADLGATTHQHPYLLFTEADKATMLERIKTDQHESEIMQKLVLEGKRYLNATVTREAPPREPRSRYVGTDALYAWMNQQANAALTLAFLYQMTGDERYGQKAWQHADALCGLESWVQAPHHYEVIYSRVWPWGAKDDEVVFTYDITAAGMTRDMSLVYDWLYPMMSKDQRNRIRGALLEKAITRVRGDYDYFWWASASRCNWTAICHSGLGLAALALLNEDPKLTDVIARSCTGVSALLDHMGDDGAWQEGRGYWAYGLGEGSFFMDAVRRATHGQIDLFKHGQTFSHPVDFALYGMTAGFGDGSGTAVGNSFFINKLVDESQDPTAAWYRKEYVRSEETVYDLIWPISQVKPQKPTEDSHYFKTIDWAVLRKDFGPEFLTVATKAGMNDDPHHGHMDCGTFNLTWQNVSFVGEVARTPYDEQYFGAQRWDHLEASTGGHNVVLVNGENQVCAKLKDQPWQTGVGGKILGYGSTDTFAYVAMDPTHAYPNKDLKSWKRWIALDKTNNIAVVLDQVGSAVGANVEVRFHSAVTTEVKDDLFLIHGGQAPAGPGGGEGGGGKRAARQAAAQHKFYTPDAGAGHGGHLDMAMLVLSDTTHTLIMGRQADVPYTEEDASVWIPYFSTVLTAKSETTVVASVFVTDPDRRSPKSLAAVLGTSVAGPTVTYTIDGQPVTYTFSESAVGRQGP